MVRSGQEDTEEELDSDLLRIKEVIIRSYGSGSVSMTELGSDPSALEEIVGDRSASVVLTTMDGETMTVFIPDRETFLDEEEGKSRSIEEIVAVGLDDGRVRPGILEVTLNG